MVLDPSEQVYNLFDQPYSISLGQPIGALLGG